MATKKMELGAEPKKLAALGGLLLVAAYLFYSNMSSSPSGPPRTAAAPPTTPKAAPARPGPLAPSELANAAAVPERATARDRSRGEGSDFKPTLKRDPDHPLDPSQIDPTLRLDLLERLAKVRMDRVDRSLFDFSQTQQVAQAIKPKLPEPVIKPKPKMIGPEPPPPPPPPAVKPPPPPINLKFYGGAYPSGNGIKRVFTMEGDDIFTLAEGDVLKRRYKIVRINPTSVVVEDLDYKHQQTVAIAQVPKSDQ